MGLWSNGGDTIWTLPITKQVRQGMPFTLLSGIWRVMRSTVMRKGRGYFIGCSVWPLRSRWEQTRTFSHITGRNVLESNLAISFCSTLAKLHTNLLFNTTTPRYTGEIWKAPHELFSGPREQTKLHLAQKALLNVYFLHNYKSCPKWSNTEPASVWGRSKQIYFLNHHNVASGTRNNYESSTCAVRTLSLL